MKGSELEPEFIMIGKVTVCMEVGGLKETLKQL